MREAAVQSVQRGLFIQAVAEGRDPGDLTTMDDPAALQQIVDQIKG